MPWRDMNPYQRYYYCSSRQDWAGCKRYAWSIYSIWNPNR